MSQEFNTCRFCHNWQDNKYGDLIKYGVRHYAHADCFLKAKGPEGLKILADWQLKNFPVFAAVDTNNTLALNAELKRRNIT